MVRLVQFENADELIDVGVPKNVTEVSNVHKPKAALSIVVTDAGIVIVVKL